MIVSTVLKRFHRLIHRQPILSSIPENALVIDASAIHDIDLESRAIIGICLEDLLGEPTYAIFFVRGA